MLDRLQLGIGINQAPNHFGNHEDPKNNLEDSRVNSGFCKSITYWTWFSVHWFSCFSDIIINRIYQICGS